MNVAVFGASGRTGRLVVAQALERGHTVTAFVRSADALKIEHAKLHTVVGDACDPVAVDSAVEGQQAVVSAIGPNTTRASTVCAESIARIISAMKRHGVARLLCVTTADDLDTGFLFGRVVRPLFLKDVYADKERQEAEIFKSGLDWTIVRPPLLRDGPRTGAYRLAIGSTPRGGWKVSRADVADFIVRELGRKDYVRQAVAIAY